MGWRVWTDSCILFYIRRSWLLLIKKSDTQIHKLLVQIYINQIQHSVRFKFKFRNFLEFLTLNIMKLIGSTKDKTTKKKNSENV